MDLSSLPGHLNVEKMEMGHCVSRQSDWLLLHQKVISIVMYRTKMAMILVAACQLSRER